MYAGTILVTIKAKKEIIDIDLKFNKLAAIEQKLFDEDMMFVKSLIKRISSEFIFKPSDNNFLKYAKEKTIVTLRQEFHNLRRYEMLNYDWDFELGE